MTETTTSQNGTDRRYERRLQTARRLLADADTDAAVVEYAQTVLSKPGYQRSRAQATLDACCALLALTNSDVSTRRTREARQLIAAVAGGGR